MRRSLRESISARKGMLLVAALATAVAITGCGGSASLPATTSAVPATTVHVTASERRWQQQVERFAAGLLPALRRLQQLTGGGREAGAFGSHLDPQIFAPGPQRRQFTSTMISLAGCGTSLRAAVSGPPTPRLRPVRVALAHACSALESVPAYLRSEVLGASSSAEIDRASLKAAAARAREGVRLLVDGLTTLRRVLGGAP